MSKLKCQMKEDRRQESEGQKIKEKKSLLAFILGPFTFKL